MTSLKTQRVTPESTSSFKHPGFEENGSDDDDTESNSDMNSGVSHDELPSYNESTTLTADHCDK